MNLYKNRFWCRYPYEITDRKTQKSMGFHRKTKECLTKTEAEKLAKSIGCGIFFCKLSNCWHLGKAG